MEFLQNEKYSNTNSPYFHNSLNLLGSTVDCQLCSNFNKYAMVLFLFPAPPGKPQNPRVTDTTRTSVSLAWSVPEDEGGSKVTGYLIEMQKVDQHEWTKCNTTPTKIREYTLTHLPQGAEYRFRVLACNAGGPGEPAEVPGTVKVTEMLGKTYGSSTFCYNCLKTFCLPKKKMLNCNPLFFPRIS